MAFITTEQARAAAHKVRVSTQKSERVILAEARDTPATKFDIFLSHSSMDKELIVGAKQLIEEAGHSVYVDWIDDADLNRAAVDRERADHLRKRMQQCETLFYAHTPNAALSRWCPWELGYFDALKSPEQLVFILPIIAEGEKYEGQEYLSLYQTADLQTYRHVRRENVRDQAFRRRMAADLLGLRPPFRGPGDIF